MQNIQTPQAGELPQAVEDLKISDVIQDINAHALQQGSIVDQVAAQEKLRITVVDKSEGLEGDERR